MLMWHYITWRVEGLDARVEPDAYVDAAHSRVRHFRCRVVQLCLAGHKTDAECFM